MGLIQGNSPVHGSGVIHNDDLRAPMGPQETAQAVLDQIRMNPETHYQGEWESVCGTRRCVAGWAQFLHEGQVSPEVLITLYDFEGNLDWDCRAVFRKGREYLGLDYDEAKRLFFLTDDDAALHALEFLAKGRAIDWDAVEGRD